MKKYFVLISNETGSVSSSSEARTPEEAFAFVKQNAKLGDYIIIYAPDGAPYRTGFYKG